MNEDDIYRSSTQFRLWSYTSRALEDLRRTSNKSASARVRDAIQRAQAQAGEAPAADESIDCLTVEEEQKIIYWYCTTAMELCKFNEFTKTVTATAIQFLKRFYLSNSPMTYHPKQMMLSAIFLATKVENQSIPASEFAKTIPKTTVDDVLAPEFLLTQGLRFTFDVRHPFRGLEGGIMELHAMGKGDYKPPNGSAMTSQNIKDAVLKIPGPHGKTGAATEEDYVKRINRAHGKAGEILTAGALLTDAYFLYTPSQIWLSALLAADQPLTEFYLHTILSGASGASDDEPSALELRLKSLLEQCAVMMTRCPGKVLDEAQKAERKKVEKKLRECRNPEKIDLVAMNKMAKEGTAPEDEKIIKKRKLERDRAAADDPFGPALTK